MSEISYYNSDLEEGISALDEIIQKIGKARGGKTKTDLLSTAEGKLREITELKKGFNLALRQLSDKEEQKKYREKLVEHTEKMEEQSRELKWSRSEADRGSLFSGAKKKDGEDVAAPIGNEKTLNAALKIQDKTKESLDNTQRMIEASKGVANATVERLEDQTQQINTITEDVNRMDDTLKRADALIRTFSRRMATDRVILFFTFLVFVGIVGIIGYSIAYPDQKQFNVPDEVKPPNPEDFVRRRVFRRIK